MPDASAPPDFFARVLALVSAVPPGRVTTYGRLARAAGSGGGARAVGWVLHGAAGSDVPCHRVVNRFGALSGARHFPTPTFMEDALRSEGVPFGADGCVDLAACVWDPEEGTAPGDGAAGDGAEGDGPRGDGPRGDGAAARAASER